jgi:hypothetical protein
LDLQTRGQNDASNGENSHEPTDDVVSSSIALSLPSVFKVLQCAVTVDELLKLGAQVRTSVRRIHFAIASGCPGCG